MKPSSRQIETELENLLASGTGSPADMAIALTRLRDEVAEHARTEEALMKAKQQLELLAANLHEAVLAYDMERHLVFANSAVERLTGYTVEDLRRENFICWIHPDDQKRMLAYWDRLFQGESYTEVEYQLVTKHGARKWVAASWGPLLDESGRQVGVQGSERDISQRKRAEAERAHLEEQLHHARKLESIGRLAGGIAHDFNNLLTVINGYSQAILEELEPGHPLTARLALIRDSGERAVELTRQLLAFSRKQVIEPRPVSLNQVIIESREMLGRLAGEDVFIVTDLAPDAGLVMVDPGQLHQVLMNLVVNARDAMPSGGRLKIATGAASLDDAAALALEALPGSYVVLTVSDTGTGMSEEVQGKVFEPFFTTKAEGKGTGLGLATVYGIARQAGGWVEVESEPGNGATFRIGLPLLRAGTGR